MEKSRQRYRIIARCMDGVRVLGYVLEDLVRGGTVVYSKDVVEQLALSKLVDNCYAQEYEGKINLKGINCKLVDMPSCTPDGNIIVKDIPPSSKKQPLYKITARIMRGKSIEGYRLLGYNSIGATVEKSISRADVVKVAKQGLVANARVQRYGETEILRGMNCDLAQLPVIQI